LRGLVASTASQRQGRHSEVGSGRCGYLFVYAELETIGFSTPQYMPYSNGLVQFGGEPAVVPDDLIVSIQRRLQQLDFEGKNTQKTAFKPGAPVIITGGVFDGYEAVFDQSFSGKERSRILIKTLNHYAMKIEVSNKTLKSRPGTPPSRSDRGND
jgi:transcription antitermination factor NusG